MLNVKVARIREDAILPTRAHATDAALDLYACLQQPVAIRSYQGTQVIPTGIAVAVPVGYLGLILPRSGLNAAGLHVSVGLVDPGYTGEVKVTVRADTIKAIYPGDRVAQLVIIKNEELELVEVPSSEMSPSERGTSGFGSTGR